MVFSYLNISLIRTPFVCDNSTTYCAFAAVNGFDWFLGEVVDILLSVARSGARYADMDERPYCKRCFEKTPVELRRRLKKQSE